MLRVMRLYAPTTFPMMSPAPILSLPDSFGVIYVGEVRVGVEGREGKGR
jgi:hypothetical protein